MQVRIMHEGKDGRRTDLGMRELSHMPPTGEPFPINEKTCYPAKAYFGPDDKGLYLLILEGEPMETEAGKAH